jgi:hypothetical protein
LINKSRYFGAKLARAALMGNFATATQLSRCAARQHRNNPALRLHRRQRAGTSEKRRRRNGARGAMAVFYKGVGVGTHFHSHDPRIHGMTSRAPGSGSGLSALMRHIARATTISPYISLTRSYGVAEMYAREASSPFPTSTTPAYVYEIDIPDPVPPGMLLIDPVQSVAASLPAPATNLSYFHDGDKDFILGVASPTLMATHLHAPIKQPPRSGGTPRPAMLTIELETLVRALRDAEVLVLGAIPSSLFLAPHAIV